MNTEYIVCMAERGAAVYIMPTSFAIVGIGRDVSEVKSAVTGQLILSIYHIHGGKLDLAQSFYSARATALAWQSVVAE